MYDINLIGRTVRFRPECITEDDAYYYTAESYLLVRGVLANLDTSTDEAQTAVVFLLEDEEGDLIQRFAYNFRLVPLE